jgi:hypothetical protein
VLCRRQEKQPASSSSNHTRTQADGTESSLISLKLWFWSKALSLPQIAAVDLPVRNPVLAPQLQHGTGPNGRIQFFSRRRCQASRAESPPAQQVRRFQCLLRGSAVSPFCLMQALAGRAPTKPQAQLQIV